MVGHNGVGKAALAHGLTSEAESTGGRQPNWQYRCASNRSTTVFFYPGIIDTVNLPGYYSAIQFKADLTVIDTATPSYTSFNRHKRIASGSLTVNALVVKHALASDAHSPLLTFCDQTGQVVDIDIRGSDAEMFARLPPERCRLQGNESALINCEESGEPRGRGRPKLGVVAREVTLLPRHWDWLAAQPGGASVTLRKLVDEARRANVDRDRQRRANECAYHFMSTIAGDMAGFEEASRALFANDAEKFLQQTEAWPSDVRDYVRCLAT